MKAYLLTKAIIVGLVFWASTGQARATFTVTDFFVEGYAEAAEESDYFSWSEPGPPMYDVYAAVSEEYYDPGRIPPWGFDRDFGAGATGHANVWTAIRILDFASTMQGWDNVDPESSGASAWTHYAATFTLDADVVMSLETIFYGGNTSQLCEARIICTGSSSGTLLDVTYVASNGDEDLTGDYLHYSLYSSEIYTMEVFHSGTVDLAHPDLSIVAGFSASFSPIPEPTTVLLVGLGGVGLLRKRTR